MLKGISYYGSHFPEHIQADFKEIKEQGCDYVVLAASEYDIEFYQGSLKTMVEQAHSKGLKVFIDLWAFGGAFGGEAASFFIGRNPDSCQVSSRDEHLPRACFNQQKFQDFIEHTINFCLDYLNLDGFFWDEPHFFKSKTDESWGCYCQVCRDKFEQTYHTPMPTDLTPEVADFRNKSCLTFLQKFSKLIKQKKPNVLISICCFPKSKDKYGFDWDEICQIEEIDIFGSDPYWMTKNKDVNYVEEVTKEVVEVAKRHNKKSEIWIQLFKIPQGREDEIKQAVEYAAKQNPDYISAWTFRAAQNSVLECGDWKKSWSTLKEAYSHY
ncbi:MAG: family 10 glycosylhydrolase [archaeon]|nr:family 10 glycosylhydrolase [archaeon]